MSEERFEQTFQVTQPAKLKVNNICGSVEILTGDEGTILVTAVKHTQTGDASQTEIEITQEADGTVKAATHFPDGSWNWMFGSRPCEVDYIVHAPRQCSIHLNGVSNSVSAEGFEGDLDVNSVSGNLTLRNMAGSTRIKMVSGDVTGDHVSGSLTLETVSGDVALNEASFQSMHVNTVSGDIFIHSPLANGPYHFDSVSGNVHLKVPATSSFMAELNSLSGDLVSAFPVTGLSRHLGSQTIQVKDGGVKVSLNSVSGDLTLDGDGEIPGTNRVSSHERLDVLGGVERGELSVEEALSKLQA